MDTSAKTLALTVQTVKEDIISSSSTEWEGELLYSSEVVRKSMTAAGPDSARPRMLVYIICILSHRE